MLAIFALILATTICVHAANFAEDADATCKCFNHILCEMEKYTLALEIVDEEEEFVFDNFITLVIEVSESYGVHLDKKQLKNPDGWIERVPQVCEFSQGIKDEICSEWLKKWTNAVSKVCAEKPEHCDGMCRPGEKSYEIATKHFKTGDCKTLGGNPF
ncbi:uncharacterized protein LOC118179860 [Stegodyphus dumicola]|uniref:uncharacterized protein LOC118179860 n=1 Tax=Stegodyphus dumicola TaxID=202533 RepID=UPI0015B1CAB1|nr:uncharacterized protein LOC118179860 [Stegodyphus dumicola]